MPRLSVHTLPEFIETAAGIKRSFGVHWYAMFVTCAPIVHADPTHPIARALASGLDAHTRCDPLTEQSCWLECRCLLDEFADGLIRDLEEDCRRAA